jgi:DNA invertase Pin-like site-specific DNA recombinase
MDGEFRMIYFYARVSTKEQNLARQLEAAKAYKKIDRVFADKQSGKNYERTEYQAMKSILVRGDEVVVKSLDRLGRNKDATKAEIQWFKEHGVILRILNVPTSLIEFEGQEWIADMVNNILIEVLASYAEQERIEIKQRQAEGIALNRAKNLPYGRRKIEIPDFEKFLKKQKEGLITVNEAISELNISRATWYNRVKALTQTI